MGAIYTARGPSGELAIKVLSAGAGANANQRSRFRREVAALQRLAHPKVVQIVDSGEEQGVPWLAMDRIQGESLAERIRYGPLDLDDALEIAGQLCEALEAVHAAGLLHRDLKPDNVMLTEGLSVVLTDFGLAKDLEVAASVELSKTGVLIGTPGYWAPEQAAGESRHSDARTDVYGVGATLYGLLTGQAPIQAPSMTEAIIATLEQKPPRPRKLRPDLPPDLERVLLQCLEKEPERRYASIAELRAALEDVDLRPAAGPRPGAWIAAGALGVLSVGALTLWLASGPAPNPTPSPAPSANLRRSPSASPTPIPPSPSASARARVEAEERARADALARKEAERRRVGREAFERGKAAYSRRRYAESAEAFREASEVGHLRAKGFLALLYAKGQGVTRDDARALALWKEAAEAGDLESMADLYYAYKTGDGAPQDPVQATAWARRAAEAGHVESMSELGNAYFMGRGVDKDLALARQWLEKASQQGYGPASNNLGFMYAKGQGVPADPARALSYLRLAVDQGSTSAQASIDVLLRQFPELR
jgi:tetratricopeptide (TPR) repeat protein